MSAELRAPAHQIIQRTTETVILAGVYFAAAKFGLRLAYLHPSATAVWPPTGIAIAALVLLGNRAWPGVLIGAFLANLTTDGTVWTSLGIAAGNTLEGLAGAAVVNAYADGRRAFRRLGSTVRFAAGAAVASTAISATIGVTTLALGGFVPWRLYGPIWLTWWLGDASGAMVVAPFVLLWAGALRPDWTARDVAERAVFVVGLLAVSLLVFGSRYPFGFAIVPFLVWAGFRFGARDAQSAVVLVGTVAISGTLGRTGPFSSTATDPNTSLIYMSLFLGTMAVIVLTIANVVAERVEAAEELRRRVAAEADARQIAERAGERATRLAAITAALSEAVTPADVAALVVDHAAKAFGAAAAALSLLAPDGCVLELVQSVGYTDDVTRRWRRFLPDQVGQIGDAMRTGRVVWLESADDLEEHYALQEELPDSMRRGARAAIPLVTRGSAVGVLYMNFAAPRGFDAEEVALMRTLAHQCAQALERARLYEREHRVAETLQRALLPVAVPQVPGLAIHATYQPGARESDVGGDWYDVFRLPSGCIALSIGDVVGHGLAAAVVMGELRQTIRAATLEHGDPAAVLGRASHALTLAHGREMMATAVVAVFDPLTSELIYATAGHPAPILASPDREPIMLPTGGVPLGYLHGQHVPSWTATLAPGSLLVLYTDGLIERTRDVTAGQEAVMHAARREAAAPSADPARSLLQQVLGGQRSMDDVAVITFALDPTPLDRFDLRLPAEPASAAVIRQSIRRVAAAAGLDERRSVALTIAVGEAVNNAIEHAYRAAEGIVHVTAAREGAELRVRVMDTGSWRPIRAPDGGGYGLHLIGGLMDFVNVEPAATGTTVTMTMHLTGEGAQRAQSGPTESLITSPAQPAAGAVDETPRPAALLAPGQARVSGTSGPRIRYEDAVPVVEAPGDLDAATLDGFRAALHAASSGESSTIIVSLEHVRYVDSQTIRALFAYGQGLLTARRTLALVVPAGSPIEPIVSMAGLSARFPVFATVAGAVRGGAPADGLPGPPPSRLGSAESPRSSSSRRHDR